MAFTALVASQARYFYPATALEILAIAVAAYEIRTTPAGRRRVLMLALSSVVGVAFALGLLLVRLRLEIYVQSHDVDQQRTYRFPMEVPDHTASLDCVVNRGLLVSLYIPVGTTQDAAIRTLQQDPAPGDSASATCGTFDRGRRAAAAYAPDPGFVRPRRLPGAECCSGWNSMAWKSSLTTLPRSPGAAGPISRWGMWGTGRGWKIGIEVKAIQPRSRRQPGETRQSLRFSCHGNFLFGVDPEIKTS